ncbi:hypothetical protein DPMN_185734 [Dreissena polymorpha]|uniref:Uncharacterized protein n=1 Tax=Dreissena polymorpha TaxID=45954 RepID=A0A9D4DMG2_DREPO|nr:hypothetical protein DPMN_185734 [Dreissena polymorpha]
MQVFSNGRILKSGITCVSCLTDKASEYYALVMDREVELGYLEVINKIERFGYRKLPETARVTFSGARQ